MELLALLKIKVFAKQLMLFQLLEVSKAFHIFTSKPKLSIQFNSLLIALRLMETKDAVQEV
jgi:hypothetical protein